MGAAHCLSVLHIVSLVVETLEATNVCNYQISIIG